MNELHLFAGAGGGILGGMLCGHTTVCAVEIEPYCRKVLLQRQRDGILPKFPIWDDVRTFDGRPWRGKVDVICGGFPCQDISCAGKGAGINGERSGLWAEMARVICEIQPKYVFVENSPMLTIRGLGVVLGSLASMGYDARWGVLGGRDVGIPVSRERIWIMASTNLRGFRERGSSETTVETDQGGGSNERISGKDDVSALQEMRNRYKRRIPVEGWSETKPEFLRTSNDVASWMDRLKAIGNGQVPAVAQIAWNTLKL
jgi:DNA (cytosine-5)-methyltransferase 1